MQVVQSDHDTAQLLYRDFLIELEHAAQGVAGRGHHTQS